MSILRDDKQTVGSLSLAEERLLDSIDEAALVQDLVDQIRIPSVTGTDAESELQNRVASQLDGLGFDVDAWKLDLPMLQSHADFPGIEAPRTEGYGVVGSLGPAGTPAIVLQGHVDVVPIGDPDKWVDRDPFSGSVREGAVHGRGACDMKAGSAANLAVARALVASGVTLERGFALHSVVSEEDGGLGAFATLLRGHGGDAAVITEPTSGRIVVANAGALTFELRVAGRAAHGSTRLEGHSAIDAFLPIYAAMHELERERNRRPDRLFADYPLPYPISLGTVRTGDWASSVPDLLIAEGRLGVQLGEDVRQARLSFESAIAAAAARDPWLRDNPVEVAWPGGQFASGWIETHHPLVDEMSAAIGDVERRQPLLGAAPYGSDLRLYSGMAGIPSLHYGPGDVRCAHAPREQVLIDELVRCTRSLALLVARRCGAHL
ncbi:MAG: putative M20/M25/M40-family peptidase [Microbacteriaceae bacterium]|nr:putative M20/M25/M40-family peptidase [Microbacteriaceae bacterium]